MQKKKSKGCKKTDRLLKMKKKCKKRHLHTPPPLPQGMLCEYPPKQVCFARNHLEVVSVWVGGWVGGGWRGSATRSHDCVPDPDAPPKGQTLPNALPILQFSVMNPLLSI